MAVSGDGAADALLPERLAVLTERKAQLAAYKGYKVSLQKKIDHFANPSASQVAERREKQNLLAELAIERLKQDRQVTNCSGIYDGFSWNA